MMMPMLMKEENNKEAALNDRVQHPLYKYLYTHLNGEFLYISLSLLHVPSLLLPEPCHTTYQ